MLKEEFRIVCSFNTSSIFQNCTVQCQQTVTEHNIHVFCVFSLMCCRHNAAHVTACESSVVMYVTARETLTSAISEGRVKLVHKDSTDIIVPDDLPHRYNIGWGIKY